MINVLTWVTQLTTLILDKKSIYEKYRAAYSWLHIPNPMSKYKSLDLKKILDENKVSHFNRKVSYIRGRMAFRVGPFKKPRM